MIHQLHLPSYPNSKAGFSTIFLGKLHALADERSRRRAQRTASTVPWRVATSDLGFLGGDANFFGSKNGEISHFSSETWIKNGDDMDFGHFGLAYFQTHQQLGREKVVFPQGVFITRGQTLSWFRNTFSFPDIFGWLTPVLYIFRFELPSFDASDPFTQDETEEKPVPDLHTWSSHLANWVNSKNFEGRE